MNVQVKSLKFKIEGRIASRHRRIEVKYRTTKRGRFRLDKPFSILEQEYTDFIGRAATFARIAMNQADFEMIPVGARFTLKLHFLVGTKAFKKDKATGLYKVARRSLPDVSNMIKCVEDALQGILFQNDRYCDPVPALGVEYGWITRFEGLDHQEQVDVEIIQTEEQIIEGRKSKKCRTKKTKE